MSKPAKVVLGLATLWPLIYIFIFMAFWFFLMFSITSRSEGSKEPPSAFFVIFILHGMTMLWVFALMIIYIVNVFNNDRVDKDKKGLWAVVLFMGNSIAMPIYWYLYIWPDDTPRPQSVTDQHDGQPTPQ